MPLIPRPKMSADTLAHCLSAAVRAHVLAGGGASEHRPVTIAFIRFEGTDAMIERSGPAATAEALQVLMSAVEAATREQKIAFLASDVDADGGKLILTAGAPSDHGRRRERMLLALRKIVAADLPIPIRIGVHRGSVFAGDIGPAYRRTVYGDGRRRQPCRAPDGQGGAGPDLRDGRRAGPLEHAIRDERARAVHGQGQGAAGSGMVGRRGPGFAQATRRAAAVAADRTRRESSRRFATHSRVHAQAPDG